MKSPSDPATPSDIERVARAICKAECGDYEDVQRLSGLKAAWRCHEKAARAAVAAMPARDWPDMRPMSEAPRDGRRILVDWADENDPLVVRWTLRFTPPCWTQDDDLPDMHDDNFRGWWPLPPLGSPETGDPSDDKAQPDKAPVAPLSGNPEPPPYEIRVPCPTCGGTELETFGDRHTLTDKHACKTCKGQGTIAAHSGERATSSACLVCSSAPRHGCTRPGCPFWDGYGVANNTATKIVDEREGER